MNPGPDKTTVVAAICTCDRNGPLEVLLNTLVANAERLGERAELGVVVVDDSPDGRARGTVERFAGRFALGLCYLQSGHQNISRARNMAIDAAAERGEWVALTDDDCEPCVEWLEALLEMQQRTQSDAVSGLYRRRVPEGSPAWLTEQPFLDVATFAHEDGASVSFAGTNNSLLSSRWWKEHPGVRFRLDLGVTGGEDVVFFRSAYAAGLRISFAARAVVYENEPLSRATWKYQLWHFFWLGNGSYVTRRQMAQATRLRMFLQGGNHLRRAVQRPLVRLARFEPPQLRYCVADVFFAVGQLIGPLGVRIAHH